MRGAMLIGIILAGLGGPAVAQQAGPPANAELRELAETAKAIAKASRDNADYARVVPDILTQILAKLDKIENKLDKIENAIKQAPPRRNAR